MTISIKIPGATFTRAVVGQLGLPHGPDTYHHLRISEAESVESRLLNGTPATVIGAPSYFNDYDQVSPANGFESGSLNTGVSTMFCVIKRPSSNAIAMGFTGGANGSTHGIYWYNNEYRISSNQGPISLPLLSAHSISEFAFVALRSDDKVARKFEMTHWGTAGRVSASVINASIASGVSKIRFGGILGAAVNIVAAGSYRKYLTDAELNDVYAYVKQDLANGGISIL